MLAYLGRYTHRVALSNDRLLAVAGGRVRFRWRDYADGDRVKVMELAVAEFLRRFLLDVVSDGFSRVAIFSTPSTRTAVASRGGTRPGIPWPEPRSSTGGSSWSWEGSPTTSCGQWRSPPATRSGRFRFMGFPSRPRVADRPMACSSR